MNRPPTIVFSRCAACGQYFFPRRWVCRRCGGMDFAEVVPASGEVEEGTELSDGTQIVSVRVHGVRIVCAADAALEAGTEVAINDAVLADGRDLPRVRVPGSRGIENERTS